MNGLILREQLDRLFKIINIDWNLGIEGRCLLVHAALLDTLRKLGHMRAKLYFIEDKDLEKQIGRAHV